MGKVSSISEFVDFLGVEVRFAGEDDRFESF